MGVVIGKGYETLNNISTRTGVTLKAFRGSPGLYFKGSREDERKAIREIKEIVVSVHWFPCVITTQDPNALRRPLLYWQA